MPPGSYYFLALALVVVPLLPFSRSAAVIALAWLPGQFVYLIGVDTSTMDMCVSILACGAGFGIAANWRDELVAASYVVSAAVQMSLLLHALEPYSAWWIDYWIAMGRILILPTTINWSEVRRVRQALKERREMNERLWLRTIQGLLCW